MILTVKDVDYLGDYTLLCTFNDGVTKKVDLQPLLKYPAFAELKDKKKFVQFGLDQTIFWYNGADIAPEYLYDNGVVAKNSSRIASAVLLSTKRPGSTNTLASLC